MSVLLFLKISYEKKMMSEMFQKPEDYLLDTLYNLQAYREIRGIDPEPAVMDRNIHQECSVFTDRNTGDRIVITKLPIDDSDFEGASVWLSNPDQGVEVRTQQWQASPYDVIFWVSKAVDVTYFNPHTGTRVPFFPVQELAERLDFPRIYPVPQSEEDPRLIPPDIEYLSTPQTNTYTLASRIFDINIERNDSLNARSFGIIDYDIGESTIFDLEINETTPSEDLPRRDEFDREFIIFIRLGNKIKLKVVPWGQDEMDVLADNYKIKVVREGMLLSVFMGGKETMCIPTKPTKLFIDSILSSATQNQTSS